jgi:hypothetical protein
MRISYNSSVFTQAGWRSVEIIANAEKLSEKRCKIVDVIDINGDGNTGYASRTGAKRQEYNVGRAAECEIGKIKNLSSCTIL